jgi:hypothetical protein
MPLGPVGQKMKASRDAVKRRKQAEDRRLHGVDFGALQPCSYCDERHAPGFCTDPVEHELSCSAPRGRCPRPCLAICVLRLSCARCGARSGASCTRLAGEPRGVVHRARYQAADRIALEQEPSIVSAAWGEAGLRVMRFHLYENPTLNEGA